MDWFLYDNGLRHEGVDLGCNDFINPLNRGIRFTIHFFQNISFPRGSCWKYYGKQVDESL